MATWSIVRFKVLANYNIEVAFADGTTGVADLSPRLSQGRPLGDGFDPLCDEAVFAKAYLEHGALTWLRGIDLAPDAMYQRIRESGTSIPRGKEQKVRVSASRRAGAPPQTARLTRCSVPLLPRPQVALVAETSGRSCVGETCTPPARLLMFSVQGESP